MKLFLRFLVASASVLFLSISAYAGEVVLKFHSFPPMPANSNAKFVKPWSEKVLAESNGEIKVEIYPAMQLGGKPPQLVDQVRRCSRHRLDCCWLYTGKISTLRSV